MKTDVLMACSTVRESRRDRRALRLVAALAGVFGTCWGALALAHHSFAAYDQNVTNMVSGTLKEFDWNAPHSGITIAYVDEKGAAQEVSVVTGAPTSISGQGFKPKDFAVGSKVTLSWHPNRNGVPGGEMAELKLEDGRVLKGAYIGGPTAGAPAAAAPAGAAPAPK